MKHDDDGDDDDDVVGYADNDIKILRMFKTMTMTTTS